ncbi:Prophage integrase IntS [BD1-7 clade bacterium]|uniref:Prophage integrase IntS n=1 Tax=BD1-7 clade bacterium TaxID=2029982 RepID=A0A5S9N478_9GAMM|nr:Prophage integrase IntS [BD1-7 clade bacterium]CAA0084573.1 Prophage integrase IntS [BD1-7 clade bacterium]
MTQRINFTRKVLSELQPQDKPYVVYDTKGNSLRLRVSRSNIKSFQVQKRVNGKVCTSTLGKFCDSAGNILMTVEQARIKARNDYSDMASGIDPIQRKKAERAKGVTLEEVFTDYIDVRGGQLANNTLSNYKGIMAQKFTKWLDQPLDSLTRNMIQTKHKKLSSQSPTSANKSMRLLRALFNFAGGYYENEHGETLFPNNPVDKITQTRSWNRETRRTGRLLNSDIKPWFTAVEILREDGEFAATVSDYLIFVLLTGMRRREASTLKWSDINMQNKSVCITDTKNHEPLEIPLSEALYLLLERRLNESNGQTYVFPGKVFGSSVQEPKKQIKKIREASGVQFTLHDLRRTYITAAENLETPHYVLKRLLNHNTSGDVTAGYIMIDIERLRPTVQKIADLFIELCEVS